MLYARKSTLGAAALAAGVAGMLAAAPSAVAADARPASPSAEPIGAVDCYLTCVSPALVRNTTPTLKTRHVAGTSVSTMFEVRTAPRNGATLTASGQTGFVISGYASWAVPAGALTDGATYFWRARVGTENGSLSRWTGWQQLTVDATAPDAATVSSPEYPEQQWGAVDGTPGTFTFESAATDTVAFVWSVTGGSATTTAATGDATRTATVTFTPSSDLTNVLEVYSLDAAGNRGAQTNYQFWVTPAPSRLAHWTLDEPAGLVAADTGGLGADGTLSGDVSFGPGYVGGANGAVFGGAGGRITAAPVLVSTKSFTVMGWVNPANLGAQRQSVVSQGGIGLYFDPAANDGTGGWCAAVVAASSATVSACVHGANGSAPAAGEWVHLAAVYDAVSGQLSMHIGGGENCVGETARAAAGELATGFGPLVIGGGEINDSWVGGIDDVWAYQRVADAEACQQALQ